MVLISYCKNCYFHLTFRFVLSIALLPIRNTNFSNHIENKVHVDLQNKNKTKQKQGLVIKKTILEK